MKLPKKIIKKYKTTCKQLGCFSLSFSLFSQSLFIPKSFACPGGPSQPEVQSFTPAGVTDMVDPFTGDFTYNIPLLEVDGYPINITYHSGITMDQEASWVGLGWNINPGVIQRNMRGIPDDFKGDEIIKEMNIKPSNTWGVTLGAGIEIFGQKGNLGFGTTFTYNNYYGFGIENALSMGISINAGDKAKGPVSGTLGVKISSSAENGLNLSANTGLGCRIVRITNKHELGLGLSGEASFNSREGLKNFFMFAGSHAKTLGGGSLTLGTMRSFNSVFNIGGHTYTPQVTIPMNNYSYTGNFQLGSEYFWLHGNVSTGGFYSSQSLQSHSQNNPSYGFLFSEEGQKNADAILDFNREKDGIFNDDLKALPLTNFTYDIYAVNGQGISGSYRPFRSDLGHVFDPYTYSVSNSQSVGFDIGIGNLVHVGEDITTTDVRTNSGCWKDDNLALNNISSRQSTTNPLFEKYYFKEANEKSVDSDPEFLEAAGGFNPKSIQLLKQADFQTVLDNRYHEGQIPLVENNFRKNRERRSQNISILTRGELAKFGLEDTPNLFKDAKPHHIGEITVTKEDGSRYVYGIAAYNTRTEETTFAVGTAKDKSGERARAVDIAKGLVKYSKDADNSIKNELGLDNYFSNTLTPPYAHSFLLTAVLSSDYVDSDSKRGPSDGDLGNYTKFHYTKIKNFKWRVPFEKENAAFNEGIRTDSHDDKGNYIYGEKELWYLDTLETKNQIAIFTLGDRKDGFGVLGKNGGIDKSKAMKLLRKISLYSKPDYQKNKTKAIPIKEIHFEYDYSLCPGVSNNSGDAETVSKVNINQKKGKLTLKKIYFTYQNSFKGKLNPYVFSYTGVNPSYNIKSYDRWGNFKPNDLSPIPNSVNTLSNSDFPYVTQNKDSADRYCKAWNLEEILIPSGGKQKIFYESDDYAYVQNKRAGQMFRISDISSDKETRSDSPDSIKGFGADGDRCKLWFKLHDSIYNPREYFEGIGKLYFKFLMEMTPDKYEYVFGYAAIESSGIEGDYGWVKLKPVSLEDEGGETFNPIVKTAIQYARINLSRFIWNTLGEPTDQSISKKILEQLVKSLFVSGFVEAMKGPNKAIYGKGYCQKVILKHSFIRLNNPNKRKLGGGCRVKKILISDEWDKMTTNIENAFDYGQEYQYNLPNGTSSGIASYEPMIGGDENSIHTPVYFKEEKQWAPDEQFYQEEPFGESFYPTPVVGYARTTIMNLKRAGVTHHGTGYNIQEFYTAKEFPVITRRTNLAENFFRDRDSEHWTFKSLFNIDYRDYLTVSQGFYIELNDMHGKPKSNTIISEGNDTISSMDYRYKNKPFLNGYFTLDNTGTVINKSGFIDTTNVMGVFHDFVTDLRESNSTISSNTEQANLDVAMLWGLPIPVPTYWPFHAKEQTRFRSAVTTKVIQRFGNLEEIISRDLGSTVSVKNLAYDAETGEVLLTQSINNFNDPVYSLKLPAYWYYDGMGPSYQNQGAYFSHISFSSGVAQIKDANKYFTVGDKLAIESGTKGWIVEVNSKSIKAIDNNGTLVNANNVTVKIISSGRKNQLQEEMASMVCKTNPIHGISSNVYENVIQSNTKEFSQGWRSYCECFNNSGSGTAGANPFLSGNQGLWRPKKIYSFLTGREVSNYNNNTNIRKDGTMESFTPLFQLKSGKWQMDERDWTFAAEVTEFNPAGNELENKDALNHYTASQFGYNQSLPVATAANSRYHEMGFDGFEDHDFSPCADNHFRVEGTVKSIVDTESHSGKKSIRVTNGTPVEMIKQLAWCDNNSCQIDFAESVSSVPGENIISVSGGLPPYQFEWRVLDGELSVKVSDTGNSISYKMINNNSDNIKMSLTVRDKNDCKGTFNLEMPQP